jgi:hypothetical protein
MGNTEIKKLGIDFIENTMRYSFNSSETRTFANRLLSCIEFGTKIKMQNIDEKIQDLLALSNEFIFAEYYSHTNKMMWKIFNTFTHYKSEKFVLCEVGEGIEKALDLAIEIITTEKQKFEN